MDRDIAPVIAAQALLAHGMQDRLVLDYVRRTWTLDPVDAGAAVRAAHILVERGLGAAGAGDRS